MSVHCLIYRTPSTTLHREVQVERVTAGLQWRYLRSSSPIEAWRADTLQSDLSAPVDQTLSSAEVAALCLLSLSFLNSTFDRSFDFDDTYLAGVLCPGVRVIPVAVGEAENTKGLQGSIS